MVKTLLSVAILMICLFLVPVGNNWAQTQRNYMMVFDVEDYSPQIKDTMNTFLNDVLKKGDQLIIVTPVRFISFSAQKLAVPKEQLLENIISLLKTDISTGSERYRSILTQMQRDIQLINDFVNGTNTTESIKGILVSYKSSRKDLINIRGDMNLKLMKFANIFRQAKGENHLMMFLEKEFRPIPDRDVMERLRQGEYSFDAQEAFISESYKTDLDYQKLLAAFNYCNVRFHFLYLQSKTFQNTRGMEYVENSMDLYDIFTKMATETNGLRVASSKPSIFVDKVGQLIEGKVTVEVINQEMGEEEDKKK